MAEGREPGVHRGTVCGHSDLSRAAHDGPSHSRRNESQVWGAGVKSRPRRMFGRTRENRGRGPLWGAGMRGQLFPRCDSRRLLSLSGEGKHAHVASRSVV